MNSQSIVTLSALVTLIISIWTLVAKIWQPFHAVLKRVDELERQQTISKKNISDEFDQLQQQGEINTLILQSIKVLMSHEIDGNHTAQLKDCVRDIDQMLYKKGGSL